MICNNEHFFRLLLTLAVSLPAISGRADELRVPALPDDPSVKVSSLPCGIRMYFVPNSQSKGMVSLALVQQPDSTLSREEVVLRARESFSEGRPGKDPIESFLSRNGIFPGRQGYISYSCGTVFSFDSLSTRRGDAALDSLLLSIFKIAASSQSRGVPSASQALVVAGDVDYASLQAKTSLLSLVCPHLNGLNMPGHYVHTDGGDGDFITSSGSEVIRVKASWRDARIPQRYMKTILPYISQKLGDEFGWILRSRLSPIFRNEGLHVRIRFSHTGSAQTSGDELTELVVICPQSEAARARTVLEEELNRLYLHALDVDEYCYGRDACRYEALRVAGTAASPSNSEAISRCTSNFILGTSLSGRSDILKFLYREMPDSTQTRLFNNYLRKRMASGCRIDSSLAVSPAVTSRDSIRKVLSSYVPETPLKLPKDGTEYVTSALKWTYSNGLNVIHKKTAVGNVIHFCYVVSGGGALSEMDHLTCLDGVSSNALSDYRNSCGIVMSTRIAGNTVRFSGSVPEDQFGTLVNILSAISSRRENVNVFSEQTYKLFVCSGPITNEQVKKTFALYAPALGAGLKTQGKLEPGLTGTLDVQEARRRDVPGFMVTQFPLNMSSHNYALSCIAELLLKDALGMALTQKGTWVRVRGQFIDWPAEEYRIAVSTRSAGEAGFAVGEVQLSQEDMRAVVLDCIGRLSCEPVDAAVLSIYKKMVSDRFACFKESPDYNVKAVVSRYIDHKDMYSRFDSELEKINAADLNNFFTAALSGIR